MTTETLTGFLLARIAEDERRAQVAQECFEGMVAGTPPKWESKRQWDTMAKPVGEFIRTNSPDRALAECAAKRAIVEEFAGILKWDTDASDDHGIHGERMGLEFAIKRLASVYADHEDFRQEWL